MLHDQRSEKNRPGGKKRKHDQNDNTKMKSHPPKSKADYNSKKPKQHGDPTEERKPFKSYQGSNAWKPKMAFSDKSSDSATLNWYATVPEDPAEFPPCPPDQVNSLKESARTMLETEITAHLAKASKDSNKSWLQTAMSQGVNRDKVAAMLLALQEDPLYNLAALRRLISFIKPGNKDCATVIDMLTEVFVKTLLRSNQPLRSFNKRPLSLLDELSANNPAGRRRRLVAWYFEDQLKYEYRCFVDAVCQVAATGVDVNKMKAVVSLARLLSANPEHEEVLLSALINKLGDSNPKVRSKTSQSLTEVLKIHPAMKGVIVEEVERLLFRPNITYKTRLSGVDFLTSLIFRTADSQVALHLLKIYFSLFKGCVTEGVVDTRLFRSLLRGVQRAYPFAHETMDSISDHMEALHRIVHIAPFSVSLHALSLLFMVADFRNSVSDRFYTALYEKILDPQLAVTKDQNGFIQLVSSALKKDENVDRVRAFIKRLLQVSLHVPVQTTCGLLYTISQIIHRKPLLAPDAVVKLEKTIKIEDSKISPDLLDDDDDGDEHYEDVKEGEDVKEERKRSTGGWVFRSKEKVAAKRNGYDAKYRNPAYAGAQHAFYDELFPLVRHYHPTVVKFATQILEGTTVSYDGNPLVDFSLTRFLERFSFKNPKNVAAKNIPHRPQYIVKGAKALPVTSRQYITMNENEVPTDELFMHRYLQARYSTRAKLEEESDDDADSVASEEFEEMLRGMMPKRKQDDEADEGVDYAADVDKTISSQKDNKKAKKKKKDEDIDDEDEDISSEDDGEGDDESDLDELSEDDDGQDDVSDEDLKSAKKKRQEDDEDEFGDDFDDLSDEDAEALDFDDDEEEDKDVSFKKKKKKTKGDGDYGPSSNVFASSEKFAELIEAAASAGPSGGSEDIINKDNAAVKQLKWEQQRDFSSKKNWSHKKKFGKGPGNKKFGKGSFNKTNSGKIGKKFSNKKKGGRNK